MSGCVCYKQSMVQLVEVIMLHVDHIRLITLRRIFAQNRRRLRGLIHKWRTHLVQRIAVVCQCQCVGELAKEPVPFLEHLARPFVVTKPSQLIRLDLRVNRFVETDVVVADSVRQFGELRLQELYIRPKILLWSSLQIGILLRYIIL